MGGAQTTYHLHPPPLNLLSTHMLLDAQAIYINVSLFHFSKFFASDFIQNIQGILECSVPQLGGLSYLKKKPQDNLLYSTSLTHSLKSVNMVYYM